MHPYARRQLSPPTAQLAQPQLICTPAVRLSNRVRSISSSRPRRLTAPPGSIQRQACHLARPDRAAAARAEYILARCHAAAMGDGHSRLSLHRCNPRGFLYGAGCPKRTRFMSVPEQLRCKGAPRTAQRGSAQCFPSLDLSTSVLGLQLFACSECGAASSRLSPVRLSQTTLGIL